MPRKHEMSRAGWQSVDDIWFMPEDHAGDFIGVRDSQNGSRVGGFGVRTIDSKKLDIVMKPSGVSEQLDIKVAADDLEEIGIAAIVVSIARHSHDSS